MTRYYRPKSIPEKDITNDNLKALYDKVSNGVVLTAVTENGGLWGNDYHKVFITSEEFKSDWVETNFKISPDKG